MEYCNQNDTYTKAIYKWLKDKYYENDYKYEIKLKKLKDKIK